MKRIVKLTESDLTRIVKRVVKESDNESESKKDNRQEFSTDLISLINKYKKEGLSNDEVKEVLTTHLKPTIKKDEVLKRWKK